MKTNRNTSAYSRELVSSFQRVGYYQNWQHIGFILMLTLLSTIAIYWGKHKRQASSADTTEEASNYNTQVKTAQSAQEYVWIY